MEIQHRLKRRVKPALFRDEATPRRIRSGPARGARMLLNRRTDLQRELGIWERELVPVYRRLIGPATVVYDVGAGEGETTLAFAALARSGTVVALEPDPEVRERLDRNLALNPALAARVVVVGAAAGAGKGSLDALIAAGQPAPQFVKIDVDGGELEVLRGLESVSPAVVVETHSAELERECSELLGGRGYDVRIVRNAWWRGVYPEYRPIAHNRWLVASRR